MSQLPLGRRSVAQFVVLLFGSLIFHSAVAGQFAYAVDDAEALREHFRVGRYERVIDQAQEHIRLRSFGEEWYLLGAESQLILGRYADARATLAAGLERYPWSIRLRWPAITAARFTGDTARSHLLIAEIRDLAGRAGWRYADAENLVIIGRAALAYGTDPRGVLENCYDRALRQSPGHAGAQQAIVELALSKSDEPLARTSLEPLLKTHEDHPDVQALQALAWREVDPNRASLATQRALEINPRHVPSLLFQAERALDLEDDLRADVKLQAVLAVNPHEPRAWALRAALLHLQHDPLGKQLSRNEALRLWATNPQVDHLIGRKLSQRYRFAEGKQHQKLALQLEPDDIAARVQLAQDHLRLGEEEQGWKLAERTYQRDGYNAQLRNLLTLEKQLQSFNTLTAPSFVVRMTPVEAEVYGAEVLTWLGRAERELAAHYQWSPAEPILVEIFPNAEDFAVRTFGMPGIPGFLGVCFGRVITLNSPAAQGREPANWQSVLWHEYCHCVTLGLSAGRVPRWLSEGISVYEERQANPAWGQRMTPEYRRRILAGEWTALHKMSSAFHTPDPGDLQFAYYQASLVIETIVSQGGRALLRQMLVDLGRGLTMSDVCARYCGSLEELDRSSQENAREVALSYAPGVDWQVYDLSGVVGSDNPSALAEWVALHPTNLNGLTLLAQQHWKQRDWPAAERVLRQIEVLFPEQTGRGSAAVALAGVYQQLQDSVREREVWRKSLPQVAADVTSGLRWLELELAASDWEQAARAADWLMATSPLLPAVQRGRALAAEQLQRPTIACAALKALLVLQPDDPAELSYRLAVQFEAAGAPDPARRAVLEALELTPQYRAAQELLLRLIAQRRSQTSVQPVTPADHTTRGQ